MLIVVQKILFLITFVQSIDFLPLYIIFLSVIETISKNVCLLLILYKTKKQKCHHELEKKN